MNDRENETQRGRVEKLKDFPEFGNVAEILEDPPAHWPWGDIWEFHDLILAQGLRNQHFGNRLLNAKDARVSIAMKPWHPDPPWQWQIDPHSKTSPRE
ncbi:hypothetical protein ROLI_024130 [Roseobacter fucihabitans]|uniref:Uncharacterized protein n=1 Tax=Roseobacter fucihabitans TaxID=1537242 RepID=A0ABZ2BTG1_9RHOB|nr:hypothetical protein [Roseobacter litoralis]MBC6965281.1 hypothetical protein [Roseobacter litoralis]